MEHKSSRLTRRVTYYIAAFRARLPPGQHTFDFIDGPYELPTTTATATSIFSPPYYTFLRSYTDRAELDAAPEHVLAHIRREVRQTGRAYDACLCFSQGAAVAAGVLMRLNVEMEMEAQAVVRREERKERGGRRRRRRRRSSGAAAKGENLADLTTTITSGESDDDTDDTFLQQQQQRPPFKAVLFICGGPPLPILESLVAVPPTEEDGSPSPQSSDDYYHHDYYKIPQKAWDLSDATGADLARKTRLMGERLAQIMARGSGCSPVVGDVKNKGKSTGSPPPKATTTTPRRAMPKFSPWDDILTLPHDAASILAHQDPRELPCSFALNPGLLAHLPLQSQPPPPPPSSSPPADSNNPKSTSNNNHHEPLVDVYGLDLRPESLPKALQILGIPTAHVYGAKDPRYPAAVQLALMCDSECRRVFDTRGGHEIPRDKAVSQEIADMIAWLEEEVSKRDKRREPEVG